MVATAAAALRLVAAIDAELGATEVVRLPSGELETHPRKTWAIPIELSDGSFAVPWKARLASIEGRSRDVGGAATRIPRESECASVTDADRAKPARDPARKP